MYNSRKYVFVCGLHRSGTSILARNVARLDNCTAFRDTGAIEDEGQFLQKIYPIDSQLGGLGRFGFNPDAHLTETSSLLTPGNIRQLQASWHSHWDRGKTICLEKTPGNLIMTRFLQAAFPEAYFIVIRRHPVPVSMASQKWNRWMRSLDSLFEHWLHCYELFAQDKKHLKRVYELTYEDWIANPAKHQQGIAEFIDTRCSDAVLEPLTNAHDTKYFDRWLRLLTNSRFKSYYRHLATKYEPRFARYGYSLTTPRGTTGKAFLVNTSVVPSPIGALLCVGAQTGAAMTRSSARLKEYVSKQQKRRQRGERFSLPRPLKVKFKRIREKYFLRKPDRERG